MAKTLGWLGGIVATVVATVVAGWLVWYLTVPSTFEGIVYDQSSNAPVSGATVIFEIQGVANNGPFRDVTDENGSYKLDISNLSHSATVIAHVEAKGYENSAPFTFSTAVDCRKDFPLASHVGALHNFVGGLFGHHPSMHINPPPKYTPKMQANHAKIG